MEHKNYLIMLSSIIDLLDWLLDLEIAGIPVGLFIIISPVIYLFWKIIKRLQTTYTDPLLDALKKYREDVAENNQEDDSSEDDPDKG